MDIRAARNGKGSKARDDFIAFWEHATNYKYASQGAITTTISQAIIDGEAAIARWRQYLFGGNTDARRAAGQAHEKLPILRRRLEALEALTYERQIESILHVPRVVAFECTRRKLVVWTESLYGFSEHPTKKWHRIGPMEISFEPSFRVDGAEHKLDFMFHWNNLSSNRRVGGDMVPAPQVDKSGRRFCIGTARPKIESHLKLGRLDLVVGTIIRYAECPHPTLGFGEFPSVPIDDVPQWYRSTFGDT